VAAQGRGGRCAQLCYKYRRSAHNHHPAARRRIQQPAGDREGAAGATGASVVDLQNSLGYTALMDAALYGHLSVLLLLLQYSVNPDLQSNKGSTAVMLAAGKGHEACVNA
jgi:ankyrin repeat protein